MLTAGETQSQKEIEVELTVDNDVMIGQDFLVRATVTNKGTKTREFNFRLHGRAMLYTGAPGQMVKSHEDSFTLKGGQSKSPIPPHTHTCTQHMHNVIATQIGTKSI